MSASTKDKLQKANKIQMLNPKVVSDLSAVADQSSCMSNTGGVYVLSLAVTT